MEETEVAETLRKTKKRMRKRVVHVVHKEFQDKKGERRRDIKILGKHSEIRECDPIVSLWV